MKLVKSKKRIVEMFKYLPTYDEVERLWRIIGDLFQCPDADKVAQGARRFSSLCRSFQAFYAPTPRCHARQKGARRATDLQQSAGP